jgi:hypothetical protein
MPAFEIDSPVDNFEYPNSMTMPPPPPIPIYGNHDGNPYTATRMWILQGDGYAPTATQNPFEAGAMPLTSVGVASWNSGNFMSTSSGVKHVRVWFLKPGSLEIQYAKADFTIKAVTLPAPSERENASNGAPQMQSAKRKQAKKAKKKPS